MLNDMGVAVYEHTPDAETLLINNNSPTAATEEEAERQGVRVTALMRNWIYEKLKQLV